MRGLPLEGNVAHCTLTPRACSYFQTTLQQPNTDADYEASLQLLTEDQFVSMEAKKSSEDSV
jgi:hypothetical protein